MNETIIGLIVTGISGLIAGVVKFRKPLIKFWKSVFTELDKEESELAEMEQTACPYIDYIKTETNKRIHFVEEIRPSMNDSLIREVIQIIEIGKTAKVNSIILDFGKSDKINSAGNAFVMQIVFHVIAKNGIGLILLFPNLPNFEALHKNILKVIKTKDSGKIKSVVVK